jgi:hypothetical protein
MKFLFHVYYTPLILLHKNIKSYNIFDNNLCLFNHYI